MNRQLIDFLKTAKGLMDGGEYAEAAETLESALECNSPAEIAVEAHFQTAFCRFKLAEYAEAEKSLETALSISEGWAYGDKKHLYELLRTVYIDQPDYKKLAQLCRRLLNLIDNNNDKSTILSFLLYACIQSDKWDEMASAIDEFPDIDLGVKALLFKTICFTKVGRIKEAYQTSHEYIEKFGEDHEICDSLMMLSYAARDAASGLKYYKKVASQSGDPELLFMIGSKLLAQDVYHGAISNHEYPEIIEGMRKNSECLLAKTSFSNSPKPFRKIRLGYLSADMGTHPVGYFLLPVMAATLTSHSFIKCYSLMSPGEADNPVTPQFMALADGWENVFGKTNSDIRQMFFDDRIDIAFDMMCHSKNNRLHLYAQRLAPVQISWIGFPVTSGVAAMDYVIADKYVDPPGSEKYYTEKLLYMPDNFLVHVLSGSPRVMPPAFTRNGYITYACFHNLVKVTDTTLRMWSRVLEKNKTAVLKIMGLLPKGKDVLEILEERFRRNAMPMERVCISPMCDMNQYFAAYNDVDIMLDTYPFSGATTTFDALRMGRPIITLVGERHVSRVSYSLLKHVGLDDLAAYSENDYVENAVRLANDRERLLEINRELPGMVENSLLTDQSSFRKNYEKIIRDAWVRYCFEARTEEYDYRTDSPPELLEQIINATVYLERKLNLGEKVDSELASEYHRAQKAFHEKLRLVTDDESFIREYDKLIELIGRRLEGKSFRLPISMAKRHLAVFCDGEL